MVIARRSVFVLLVFGCLFAPSTLRAHVGSPNVSFENHGGPYPLLVSIRPPEVVPGLAEINVRFFTNTVKSVTVLPVRWDAGRKGSPKPDPANSVKGETNLYSAQLWLMDMGAYSVFVNIEGSSGPHTEIVPLNSVALRRLPMSISMQVLFVLLGGLLFVGLIAIIGSAVRESTLAPSALMDPRANRRSWYATGLGVVILAALLVVGKRWWDRVDADFKNNRLYRTRPAISQVKQSPAGNQLELLLENSKDRWYDSTRLVTDHGKLMHLFLVRQPGADAFAHLHPVRKEGANEFTSALPAVPTGKYWLFADVTHESGFAETYTSEVEIPRTESVSKENFDPDDSWWNRRILPVDSRIERTSSGNVKTGHQVTLDFRVYDSKGQPASVDFYMGMPAHAR